MKDSSGTQQDFDMNNWGLFFCPVTITSPKSFNSCWSYHKTSKLREEHERRTVLPARWRQKTKLPVQDDDDDDDDDDEHELSVGNLKANPPLRHPPPLYHGHNLHEADPRSRCARWGRSGSLEASDWTSLASNVNPPSWNGSSWWSFSNHKNDKKRD